MRRIIAGLIGLAVSGCAVYSVVDTAANMAGTVVETTADVAAGAVETTADIAGGGLALGADDAEDAAAAEDAE